MTDTATPATGPVDAPASDNSMASVLAEFSQEPSDPKEDAVQGAVREMTEQASEGEAQAPDAGEGEVETPEVEEQEAEEGDPSEAEDAEPADTGRYTVKVNGQEQRVTLQELKDGYSRTEDYKAKTMALADDRRALDTEKSGIKAQLSSEYADQLKQQTDLFVQLDPLLAQADSIDWQQLAQDDPNTYTQLRAAVDARVEAVKKARGEMQRVSEEQAEARRGEIAQGLTDTEAAIRASDPAFSDDARFKSYVNDAVTGLMEIGLDGDDMTAILSNPQVGPKALSLITDALAYRKQQQAKGTLPARRVVPAPQAKPLKSDAPSGPQPRKAPATNSSRDAKVSWAVQELLESQGA